MQICIEKHTQFALLKKKKEKNKATETPSAQSQLLPSTVDMSSAARTRPTLGRISANSVTISAAQIGHPMTEAPPPKT